MLLGGARTGVFSVVDVLEPLTWVTIASTNATPTAATPISLPFRGIRFPNSRIRKNEAAGMTGMIQACSRNGRGRQPFIESTLVEVDALAVAVDEQHHRQPDADLGGGDGDHEQGENGAGDVAVAAPNDAG